MASGAGSRSHGEMTMTMTDPTPAGEDARDRIMRIIMARCPELTDADLASLAEAAPDPEMLPVAIANQILEVLGHLMDRMEALEKAARVGA